VACCGEGGEGATKEERAGPGAAAGEETPSVFRCVDEEDDDKYMPTREGGEGGGCMGGAAAKERVGGLEGDGGRTSRIKAEG